MLDTTHADAISDDGVAFWADALPNSTEGVAFSAAFQAKGLHFRPLPTRADAISDERVAFWADSLPISDEGVAFSADSLPISVEGGAFSAAFQAKGLHFRPLARGWGAFLAKGSHFLPQTAPHVSTCMIGRKHD